MELLVYLLDTRDGNVTDIWNRRNFTDLIQAENATEMHTLRISQISLNLQTPLTIKKDPLGAPQISYWSDLRPWRHGREGVPDRR